MGGKQGGAKIQSPSTSATLDGAWRADDARRRAPPSGRCSSASVRRRSALRGGLSLCPAARRTAYRGADCSCERPEEEGMTAGLLTAGDLGSGSVLPARTPSSHLANVY